LPQGHFPAPSEKSPVSADMDSVVLKALHKERKKRQQSAEELKNDIATATNAPLTQSQKSDDTAWQVFLKVPLWVILFACFGLLFVVPSILFLADNIIGAFNGRAIAKQADIFFALLVVVIFITALVIMRSWRLKTPAQKGDKFAIVGIVILGLVIPYIAGGIGAAIYGFKPWFYGMGIAGVPLVALFSCVAIGIAGVIYHASRRFGNLLKYLPVICGYIGFAYMYLGFDISGDAQAGIALIFIPIWSIFFFIIGYWSAWGIYTFFIWKISRWF